MVTRTRLPMPPYFVVSVSEHGEIVSTEQITSYADGKEKLSTGVGVINYFVGTYESEDRLFPKPADIEKECALLMLEVTSNRHTSSPQCIPVAKYKQMTKLADQYKTSLSLKQEIQ